jgi:glycosyltransferase involved in cell wall biosynthesis
MSVKTVFLAYDLSARGGISYYAKALSEELESCIENYELKEIKARSRWLRGLSVFWLGLTLPKGSLIISSHINFLLALAPLKRLKQLHLTVITYNREVDNPAVRSTIDVVEVFFPLFKSGKSNLLQKNVQKDQIKIIYNILKPTALTTGEQKTTDKFLILCRLDRFDVKVKGVFYFLRALRFAKSVSLTIAGSGDAMKSLQEYCHRHNIADRVSFIGQVNNQRKIQLMSEAAYFVHLSNGEGLPCIAVMEAVDQGCVTIIHNDKRGDVATLPNNFECVLVDRHQTRTLAKKLMKLAQKPVIKDTQHMLRAKDSVSSYSAKSAAANILSRIETL